MERKKSLSGIKIQPIDGAGDTLQRSIVSSPVHMFPGELSSQSPAHSSSVAVGAIDGISLFYTFELLPVIFFISELLCVQPYHTNRMLF